MGIKDWGEEIPVRIVRRVGLAQPSPFRAWDFWTALPGGEAQGSARMEPRWVHISRGSAARRAPREIRREVGRGCRLLHGNP